MYDLAPSSGEVAGCSQLNQFPHPSLSKRVVEPTVAVRFSAVVCPDFVLLHVFSSLTVTIHPPSLLLVLNNKSEPPFVGIWVLKRLTTQNG